MALIERFMEDIEEFPVRIEEEEGGWGGGRGWCGRKGTLGRFPDS